MRLVREAYMQALKSPIIALTITSDTGVHQIPCALAFLALHSEYFAKILSKPGVLEDGQGSIQLQNVRKDVVECFVHWCYLGQHLSLGLLNQFSPSTTSEPDLESDKTTLIDLWIFCDEHAIPHLQNETMTNLRLLLSTHPSLLTPQDILSIFTRTADSGSPLRRLAIIVLVAQLHSPGTSSTKIEDFEDLVFKGAISLFYKSMRNWENFSARFKGPEGQKLGALLGTGRMVELLSVPVAGEVGRWVLELCGMVGKKEEQEEEEGPSSSSMALGSGLRGEPIEVD